MEARAKKFYKPTHYAGRLYRSQLEARWARYFGLRGWVHYYEPRKVAMTYPRRNYVPDFGVRHPQGDMFWEAKPLYDLELGRDPRWILAVRKTGLPLTVSYGFPGWDKDFQTWAFVRDGSCVRWSQVANLVDGVDGDLLSPALRDAAYYRFEVNEPRAA